MPHSVHASRGASSRIKSAVFELYLASVSARGDPILRLARAGRSEIEVVEAPHERIGDLLLRSAADAETIRALLGDEQVARRRLERDDQ